MRSRTANWFVCRIGYEKIMEDGLQKKVKENYVVDAVSFTEAEARITESLSAYISGWVDIQEIDRAVYHEIFFTDKEVADKWYKCKLQFITIDEKTGKEKKSAVYYLVQGSSLENARKNIEKVMVDSMTYVIVSICETSVIDVFEYTFKK